jgi:hypothetical protein
MKWMHMEKTGCERELVMDEVEKTGFDCLGVHYGAGKGKRGKACMERD